MYRNPGGLTMHNHGLYPRLKPLDVTCRLHHLSTDSIRAYAHYSLSGWLNHLGTLSLKFYNLTMKKNQHDGENEYNSILF